MWHVCCNAYWCLPYNFMRLYLVAEMVKKVIKEKLKNIQRNVTGWKQKCRIWQACKQRSKSTQKHFYYIFFYFFAFCVFCTFLMYCWCVFPSSFSHSACKLSQQAFPEMLAFCCAGTFNGTEKSKRGFYLMCGKCGRLKDTRVCTMGAEECDASIMAQRQPRDNKQQSKHMKAAAVGAERENNRYK